MHGAGGGLVYDSLDTDDGKSLRLRLRPEGPGMGATHRSKHSCPYPVAWQETYGTQPWGPVWVALLRVHAGAGSVDESLLLQCIKDSHDNGARAMLSARIARKTTQQPSSIDRTCQGRLRAGLEVLYEEQDFRRCQSVQNAHKAAIWAICNHTVARLLCMRR